MFEAAIGARPQVRVSIRTALLYAMVAVITLHVLMVLAPGPHVIGVSRLFTATVPMLAAFCCMWRAQHLSVRERMSWRWLAASLLLWAAGQVIETFIGQSTAASNLAVDASDYLYITASFPLLLAVSSTRRTDSIRWVFYLDSAQIILAAFLTFVLLYQMSMPAALATTVMGRIYGADVFLLATAVVLRLATWSTYEERRRIRLMVTVVWIYAPIELGMDYATKHWNLQGGNLLDLLWSVPFLYAGWQALYLRMDEEQAGERIKFGRIRTMVESLCPMLITAGIFALAASVVSQHAILGLSAIFLLLLIQSLHAGVVQLNYVLAQDQLLERGNELKEAIAALERLSQLDPLTGIPNRRRFTAALEDAAKRAVRRNEPLSVLMIDVDYFKGINDLHGHTYGDECLVSIARALGQQANRPDDLLARFGGEEFVLLLPATDAAGARVVAERIREAAFELGILNDASPYDCRLTVSVGIGACVPKAGMTAPWLVDIADQALYEAKRLGRNRVVVNEL